MPFSNIGRYTISVSCRADDGLYYLYYVGVGRNAQGYAQFYFKPSVTELENDGCVAEFTEVDVGEFSPLLRNEFSIIQVEPVMLGEPLSQYEVDALEMLVLARKLDAHQRKLVLRLTAEDVPIPHHADTFGGHDQYHEEDTAFAQAHSFEGVLEGSSSRH